jgi:pyrroloquinoline quinone (PQQ) biosynthesis protein C
MNTKLSHLFETKQKLIDRVGQHSFLQRCSQKAVSVEELKFFLVQQGIYSGYFTRYLCSMMGNLPKSEYVVRVADNLCDELGLTQDHSIQHSTTYREMLASFGLTLEGAKPLEGTRRFIDTMFDHCRDLRAARGLSALCLGAEALVPSIYSHILTGFQGCDVPESTLAFFSKHVECDDGHADVMWEIMLDMATNDPDQIPLMVTAGEALVDARHAFFTSVEQGFKAMNPSVRDDAELAVA